MSENNDKHSDNIADNQQIYLDYAAATPLDGRVFEAMLPYFSENFYNPSAPYARARTAKDALEHARSTLAHAIGARPASITLTAGATEANNLALASSQGHIVASAIEHESVLSYVRKREHTLLPVSSEGLVKPERLREAITPDTQLVSIALANGEVGSIQPMRELAAVVREERLKRESAHDSTPLWLHTDASQAAATCSLNISSLGADLITVSAAKIYGPKQVGFLWASDRVCLRPLVLGGGQENGLRSGTENVAGAVGFAKALQIAGAERANEAKRLARLRDNLQARILAENPWAIISGPKKNARRLPGLLHISFPGLQASRLVILLDRQGVSVGTGSACAASKMQRSHVLEAIGLPDDAANGSLRFTLGRFTTPEQIEQAAAIINGVVAAECSRLGLHQGGAQ